MQLLSCLSVNNILTLPLDSLQFVQVDGVHAVQAPAASDFPQSTLPLKRQEYISTGKRKNLLDFVKERVEECISELDKFKKMVFICMKRNVDY